MSAETDFRALLAAHAGTVALVGTSIAHNAIRSGTPAPYVVFTCQHSPQLGLDNTLLADQCSFAVQCWAATASAAETVATAVSAAVATATSARGACVVDRASGYDDETGLDATILTVEWWA